MSILIWRFNAMAITPFVEYVYRMGLKYEYNCETDEYKVMVITTGWATVVATVPVYIAHHELFEAKQLIKAGLDLHNCFT